MRLQLPLSFFIFLLHLGLPVWSSASLIPPSTFPTISSTSTTSSGPVTGTRTASGSGSLSASSSASSTSSAQFPSLSNVPSCVSNCLAVSIGIVNCTSVTDVNCFCPQPNFSPELVDCVLASCPDQVSESENIAQQFCNVASTSVSLTFPSLPVTSSTPSSSSTSTSSPSASTSTAPPSNSSNAALHFGKDGSYLSVYSIGVSLLGALLGAVLVH